jgi:TetR/AcrR family transcriptional regulator, tetracycline repressor protein
MYFVSGQRTCILSMSAPSPYSGRVTSVNPAADRTRLTRAAVVTRALQLADEMGLEALTIRKLSADLGVTPMALYWHFRSKEELLDGLTERVWAEIDTAADRPRPWPEQLRRLLESLIVVLRAHPAAGQLLQAHRPQGEAALRASEAILEVLRSGGFTPSQASAIAKSALWTGIMLALSDPGAQLVAGEDVAEHQRIRQVQLATLPIATYPRLVECAVPMSACDDPESHYQFGIDLFMSGVEAIASADPEAQKLSRFCCRLMH